MVGDYYVRNIVKKERFSADRLFGLSTDNIGCNLINCFFYSLLCFISIKSAIVCISIVSDLFHSGVLYHQEQYR